MSKAALFAVNTAQQTLTGGGSVDLGNPVHGFGQSCCQKAIGVSGNNLNIRNDDNCSGMYGIIMSATVTASAPATVTLQAFQDGTPIGTPQAVTVAAANDAQSATVNIGPRVAGRNSSIITLVATTTAGNVIIGGVSTLAWKL